MKNKMLPEIFELILDHLFDGVYYVDRNRMITYWNNSAERISGFSKDDVVGRSCADNILRHIDESGKELCKSGCPLAAAITDGKQRQAHIYLHHRDGHRVPVIVRVAPIRDSTGAITGAVEIFTEGGECVEIERNAETLRSQAYRDPLTHAGNRKYFELVFESKQYEIGRFGSKLGLIFFDIDKFKKVNDRYGHQIGDRVLMMVTRTATSILRKIDHLFRWGGEEFVVLLPHVQKKRLIEVAERLRVFIKKSYIIVDGRKLSVSVSIGGTMVRQNDTIESIIERADLLMYQSKKKGRNTCTIG